MCREAKVFTPDVSLLVLITVNMIIHLIIDSVEKKIQG